MSCTLRAGGLNFDVDSFLATSSLTPCAIFRRGEPKFPVSNPKGRICETSSFNVGVSDAEFGDEKSQTHDALLFLEKHENELKRLAEFPGNEGTQLDFAIYVEPPVFAQSYCLPPNLLLQMGRLGIELCISCYAAPEEESHPTPA
ncbi:hypothetical protein KP001_01395 [Geomonas subterranea]|uniref:DUF4279 domain-containing protein n=1 Tax=Geomonas subterranea TaxID=2847989 RepID=A0ABX8LLM7_9BACT|nr:hypothetical protein [Geomonas subterranea]QXE91224.1 hypothetical protein KP001_01395 [Geomonas subterranea]QXM10689.1 hypothetical protein KP002_06095 [Geomonas subterranea]